jgi:hypothetical protein
VAGDETLATALVSSRRSGWLKGAASTSSAMKNTRGRVLIEAAQWPPACVNQGTHFPCSAQNVR